MLELNKIRFNPASPRWKPQREINTTPELKQLWPKIMALEPGEWLEVPYKGNMWIGISYCRKLTKLVASQPARNLKVRRNKSHLYIFAERDIWQPIEESWEVKVGALSYVMLFAALLTHWTPVQWIAGFLLGGSYLAVWAKQMKILKDHMEKLQERLEGLEARFKAQP